ncbi:MAG: PLDc N-terminal domain-containing protein [Cryobacterium sp.]|nr:PLDc N-terminal domain-containing protein [Micrococcales bacterium]MBX3308943.1 PLDc N-terminal domain-containing protein [Cryobacterium sp.]
MDQLFVLLVFVTLGVIYVAAIVYAFVQISRTLTLNRVERWVWVLSVLFFPLVAALVWFIAGPHPVGPRLGNHDWRGPTLNGAAHR